MTNNENKDQGQEMQVAVDQSGKSSAVFVHPGKEGERIAALKERAAIPEECGTNIPVAPARGTMVPFTPRENYITDTGKIAVRQTGHIEEIDGVPQRRLKGAKIVDVWDRMEGAAYRAYKARTSKVKKEGKAIAEFVPPFTPGQVYMAREYAVLVERIAASGVSCSSLHAKSRSSSGSGGKEEARLYDIETRRLLERRIGTGLAKSKRRPSQSGSTGEKKQVAIRVLDLVRHVAVEDLTLDDVLKKYHWARTGANRAPLKRALAAALDRMIGYDLNTPQ